MGDIDFSNSPTKYISSKEAAKLCGVTHDHVSRLCRQGKILGHLQGRTWLVEKNSACAFFHVKVEIKEKNITYVYNNEGGGREILVYPESKDVSRIIEEKSPREPAIQAPKHSLWFVQKFSVISLAVIFLLLTGVYAIGRPMIPSGTSTAIVSQSMNFPANIFGTFLAVFQNLLPPKNNQSKNVISSPLISESASKTSPTQTTPLPPTQSPRPVAVTGPRNVVERVTERLVGVGISEAEGEAKLQALNNKLSSEIYKISAATGANQTYTNNIYSTVAQTNRIDMLDSVDITKSTFSGGSVSNSSFSGTTGSFSGNVSISGDLIVSGNNNIITSTSGKSFELSTSNGIQSLSPTTSVAVSLPGTTLYLGTGTATSTLTSSAGKLGLGSTTPFGLFSISATSTVALSTVPIFVISTSTANATSTALIVDANGKVGIGSTSPSATLGIAGNLYVTGLGSATSSIFGGQIEVQGTMSTSTFRGGLSVGGGLRLDGLNCANGSYSSGGVLTTDVAGNVICDDDDTSGGASLNAGNANTLAYYSGASTINSANIFSISASAGLFGIGTTTPWANLSVAGLSTTNQNVPYLAFSTTTGGTATSTLFQIARSGNVSIGASSTPFANLSIEGRSLQSTPLFMLSTSTASATSTAFIIDANGKVGIGTSSPYTQLSVAGNGLFSGSLSAGSLAGDTSCLQAGTDGMIARTGSACGSCGGVSFGKSWELSTSNGVSSLSPTSTVAVSLPGTTLYLGTGLATSTLTSSAGKLGLGSTSPFGIFSISATSTAALSSVPLFVISTSTTNSTTTALIVDSNGKVGIGSTSPYAELSVAGTTGAEQLSIGRGQGGASSTSAGGGQTAGLSSSNGLTISGGAFNLNLESFTDLTGSGLSNLSGVLSLDSALSFVGKSWELSTFNGVQSLSPTTSVAVSLPGTTLYLGTGLATSTLTSSAGKLGLGSTSPFGIFSISATSTAALSSVPLFVISTSTTNSTTTALIVDSNGKVGIGSTSPYAELSVAGTIGAEQLSIGRGQGGASSTFAGGVQTAGLSSSNGLTISGGAFNLNLESFTDLTGSGLENIGGVLSLSSSLSNFGEAWRLGTNNQGIQSLAPTH